MFLFFWGGCSIPIFVDKRGQTQIRFRLADGQRNHEDLPRCLRVRLHWRVACQILEESWMVLDEGFHAHGGTPNRWMIHFMENPIKSH